MAFLLGEKSGIPKDGNSGLDAVIIEGEESSSRSLNSRRHPLGPAGHRANP
jgi:hypothetical protein